MCKGRKVLAATLVMLMCFGISGCGSDISLNEEQNELVAEYAANAILQRNSEYKDRLDLQEEATTQAEVISTTESTTQAEKQESVNSGEDSDAMETTEVTAKVADISELFSKQKLTVLYKGYKVVSQYSDKNQASSSVEAQSGKKLLVVQFQVKNTSSKKNKVDLLDSNVSYKLHTDTGETEPMLTLLEDDLALFQGSLKAGASKKLVLLFEISNEETKKVNYQLDITNQQNTATIEVH